MLPGPLKGMINDIDSLLERHRLSRSLSLEAFATITESTALEQQRYPGNVGWSGTVTGTVVEVCKNPAPH